MIPTVLVTDAPSPDARALISDGLNEHNRERAGIWDSRPLAVLALEPGTDIVLGGLIGRTSLGLAFIDLVFLPETLRGQGLGSRLLQAAETEAKQRGCKAGVLFTISFQAPEFYARHGWEEFGRVDCDPPGTARVFFRKRFDQT